jgi:hypothetical protein
MTTSLVSAGAVNGNGAASTNGTTSILERGLQLAAALAASPDVAINPPVDFPDHYPDETPTLDDDAAEAAEMFAEMDARQHLDLSQRLTLDQLIDRQIEFYEGWGNEAGKMFAQHMTELLLRFRWVQATTPAEYDVRHEIVEQDARETWWKQGFEEGKAAGIRLAAEFCGPLD